METPIRFVRYDRIVFISDREGWLLGESPSWGDLAMLHIRDGKIVETVTPSLDFSIVPKTAYFKPSGAEGKS